MGKEKSVSVIELPGVPVPSFEVRAVGRTVVAERKPPKIRPNISLPPIVHEDLLQEAGRLDGSHSGLLNSAFRRFLISLAEEPLQVTTERAQRARERYVDIEDAVPKPYLFWQPEWEAALVIAEAFETQPSSVIQMSWLAAREAYARLPTVNMADDYREIWRDPERTAAQWGGVPSLE